MRRILTLLCLCVLTLALAGCAEDKTKAPEFDKGTLDPNKAMEQMKESGGPSLGAPGGPGAPAAAPEKEAE